MPKVRKKRNLVKQTGKALGKGAIKTATSIGDAIVTTAKIGAGIRKGIDTINAPLRKPISARIGKDLTQAKKNANAARGRLSKAAKKKLREKTKGLRKIKLTQTIKK